MILKTLSMGKSRKIAEGRNETWISAKLEYEVNAEDYKIDEVQSEIAYILSQLEKEEKERWTQDSGKN